MPKSRFKLGDAIAKLTKMLHIPHCAKCERRRLILNEIGSDFADGKAWSLDKIISKMKNCCDEK
ncbi:MAG: hypothetical protein HYT48_00720 [Candidatus Vogelbacteria bacterium]|nr:hypothetical protein [Candidatus Vogelbacteria bacterium]